MVVADQTRIRLRVRGESASANHKQIEIPTPITLIIIHIHEVTSPILRLILLTAAEAARDGHAPVRGSSSSVRVGEL